VTRPTDMDTLVPTRPLIVERVGATAHAVLAASSRGRVVAVPTKAVYLESESGELFTTTDGAPTHAASA
jgi:hypothetical protein